MAVAYRLTAGILGIHSSGRLEYLRAGSIVTVHGTGADGPFLTVTCAGSTFRVFLLDLSQRGYPCDAGESSGDSDDAELPSPDFSPYSSEPGQPS